MEWTYFGGVLPLEPVITLENGEIRIDGLSDEETIEALSERGRR